MEKHLKHPVFQLVSETARKTGVKAYVVGGFVRDIILNRPSVDIDIVVVGSGIELACEVASQMKGNPRVNQYKNFGTAMFTSRWRDKEWQIEFVGARKESYSRDSRKPIVENGSLEDDQKRRDFTINALAISLNKEDYGTLVDPFGGIQDIETKTIRTPLNPDITFSDDPLRMLRAIRFATQLSFHIEDKTFAALERNKERISIISQERIYDELTKMIASPRPSIGFKLLEKGGLLNIILPELQALKGVETIEGKGHKDNFYHTLAVLDNVCDVSENIWLRWSAVFHDIAKPQTKKYVAGIGWTFHGHEILGTKMVARIFRRMKFPLDDRLKYVTKLVLLHLRPIVLSEDIVTDSAVRRLLFDAGDEIDDLMTLCSADITSKNQEKVKKYLRNFELVRVKLKEIEEKDRVRNFQPPVSGEEIMEYFNLQPCKEVGIIKNAIKDAILDGDIHNERSEAIHFMLARAAKLGLKPVKPIPDAI